jgi:hypothetical protein
MQSCSNITFRNGQLNRGIRPCMPLRRYAAVRSGSAVARAVAGRTTGRILICSLPPCGIGSGVSAAQAEDGQWRFACASQKGHLAFAAFKDPHPEARQRRAPHACQQALNLNRPATAMSAARLHTLMLPAGAAKLMLHVGETTIGVPFSRAQADQLDSAIKQLLTTVRAPQPIGRAGQQDGRAEWKVPSARHRQGGPPCLRDALVSAQACPSMHLEVAAPLPINAAVRRKTEGRAAPEVRCAQRLNTRPGAVGRGLPPGAPSSLQLPHAHPCLPVFSVLPTPLPPTHTHTRTPHIKTSVSGGK